MATYGSGIVFVEDISFDLSSSSDGSSGLYVVPAGHYLDVGIVTGSFSSGPYGGGTYQQGFSLTVGGHTIVGNSQSASAAVSGSASYQGIIRIPEGSTITYSKTANANVLAATPNWSLTFRGSLFSN